MGKGVASNKSSSTLDYTSERSEGVIPKPRVFSSGAMDLPQICSVFIRHRQHQPAVLETNDASTKKQFFVYILTNGPKPAVLYTGITGNLPRRVWQHKNKLIPGFTSRYNLTRLVYYEQFVYPDAAISREKQIKGWRRSKKIRLIESLNPRWEDLAKDWGREYKPAATDQREIPRPAGENAGLRDDASVSPYIADKTVGSR